MLAIGLMSGTSLDGVDAALVKIEDEKFTLEDFITLEYPESFRKKLLRNLSDKTAKLSEISSLNFELSDYFVKAIDKLLEKTNHKYNDIEFVASHGQTIWHDPKGLYGRPSTLQIGEGSVITEKTGITVINNFRSADVSANGEGAPLVPMSEYMIYHSNDKSIILQNIGGIGNLTYLKRGGKLEEVLAFDTGPGNCMIDYFVKRYFNKSFDEGGNIAKSGDLIVPLLDHLKEDPYLDKNPPKSTGREYYSTSFMESLIEKFDLDSYKREDVVKTITYFTAYSIYYNYQKFIKDFDLVVLSGGGSHNKYIIEVLRELLKKEVVTQEDFGYDSDSKEAMAFAVLGYLTINHRFGNVKSATGAKKDMVLGNIYYGKKME